MANMVLSTSKSIAPGRGMPSGSAMYIRSWKFDLHQTRYRPKIYRCFLENVTIIKFYWRCQGVTLT